MPRRARKKRRMGKPNPRWECRAYLDWVKTQPCMMTGLPADDPHHIIGVGGLSGMALTAPDWAAMPLTRGAHDQIGEDSELWAQQWEWVARTLGKAIEEGVLVFRGASDG